MADPAKYQFLSWMRRGVSTNLTLAAGATRATFHVEVAVKSAGPTSAQIDFSLFGAGDVTGLDTRVVTRAWPRPGARDAEPNHFPLIEFSHADLPWRYSPAPGDGSRVLPWLCLAVLRNSEVNFTPPVPGGKLGVLNVAVSALPNLSQSWAWAHTQFSGSESLDPNSLAGMVDGEPERFLSRILAPATPGLLQPDTEYTAFLVPTFERGRLAGLGQNPAAILATAPAWTSGVAGSIALPVFYQWGFHTGPQGDFKSLVEKLRPHPLPETVGGRAMDVATPGFGLPAAADTPLFVEGALRSPAFTSTGSVRANFIQKLRDLLNLPTQLLQASGANLIVAPPLYGRWHAAQTEVDAGSQPWFSDLNSDPSLRVAAGAGTIAVQNEQQSLLASAWAQVDSVRAANQALRWKQFGLLVAGRLHDKIFATPNDTMIVRLAAPVLARITGSPVTLRKLIADSPMADGILEPQFRRLARPLGPLGRRQGRTASGVSSLIERMNRGEFFPASPPPTPAELPTLAKTIGPLAPSWATPERLNFLRGLPFWLMLLGILLAFVALLLVATGAITLGLVAGIAGVAGIMAAPIVRRAVARADALVGLSTGNLSPEQIQQIPLPENFVPISYASGSSTATPIAAGLAPAALAKTNANFRTAAAALFSELSIPPVKLPPLRSVSLATMRAKIATAIEPRTTATASMHDRLYLGPIAFQPHDDPVEPIMAAPEFPAPMYKPLRAISQDWILPGIAAVVPNSAALAVTNQKFIEAYMVGRNHEMSRTLLFNEYPTDMRGTYFRQFWDSSGYFGDPGAPDDFKDIQPIHAWQKQSNLGEHTSRRPPTDHIVLLIRGEVLLRYPNTIVYAAKAVREGNKHVLPKVLDASNSKPHIFHGELDPDIRFFGFELTETQAKTEDGNGWFFVLQQHPDEPHFGFDAPSGQNGVGKTFKTLTWSDVLPQAAVATPPRYLDLTTSSTVVQQVVAAQGIGGAQFTVAGGSTAASFAKITLRHPVRVAYHAAAMLPGA
jgi:hypothetical protein